MTPCLGQAPRVQQAHSFDEGFRRERSQGWMKPIALAGLPV